jgi:hypothetical protein
MGILVSFLATQQISCSHIEHFGEAISPQSGHFHTFSLRCLCANGCSYGSRGSAKCAPSSIPQLGQAGTPSHSRGPILCSVYFSPSQSQSPARLGCLMISTAKSGS